jgi:hypothetical protein
MWQQAGNSLSGMWEGQLAWEQILQGMRPWPDKTQSNPNPRFRIEKLTDVRTMKDTAEAE